MAGKIYCLPYLFACEIKNVHKLKFVRVINGIFYFTYISIREFIIITNYNKNKEIYL